MLNIKTPFQVIATSTSSGRLAYSSPSNTQFVRVFNEGTVTIFVNSGDSTVTAASTNVPIGGGKSTILEKGVADTHFAAIAASGTPNIYFAAVTTKELEGF